MQGQQCTVARVMGLDYCWFFVCADEPNMNWRSHECNTHSCYTKREHVTKITVWHFPVKHRNYTLLASRSIQSSVHWRYLNVVSQNRYRYQIAGHTELWYGSNYPNKDLNWSTAIKLEVPWTLQYIIPGLRGNTCAISDSVARGARRLLLASSRGQEGETAWTAFLRLTRACSQKHLQACWQKRTRYQ